MDLDLSRIAIFLAVVDAGSLSAAAPRVHLSQPAVSRNLKQLEAKLGVDLFARRGRGLTLTSSGRALVPLARDLIARAETLERAVQATAQRSYYDLRLGMVDSIATYLFPRVVAPLRQRYPELHLKLQTARTASLIERLRDTTLDLVLAAHHGPPEGLRAVAVGPYRRKLYGRADTFPTLADIHHERDLAAFPIIELEALPGQPTLIPDDAPSFAIANSLASIKALVLGGFGVASLLTFMLTPQERGDLVTAAIPDDPDCHIYVLSNLQHTHPKALEIERTLADALSALNP